MRGLRPPGSRLVSVCARSGLSLIARGSQPSVSASRALLFSSPLSSSVRTASLRRSLLSSALLRPPALSLASRRSVLLSSASLRSASSMSLKRKAADAALDGSEKKPKANASITAFFGPPKIVSSTPTSSAKSAGDGVQSSPSAAKTTDGVSSSPVAVKATDTAAKAAPLFTAAASTATKAADFDKETWVASLTDEQKTLLALEIGTLDPSWLAVLHKDLVSAEFLFLKKFLASEATSGKKIFPPSADVYSWSRHTPLHTVKAVILGQDPYHNVNQAHGLCFSVRPPTPAPPSLKNMYTALKRDYPSFQPPPRNGGLLTPWADRGVLLLNTCLTVRAHEANSHAGKGWERLTQRVIDVVAAQRKEGVVFLAWGTPAQKRIAKVDTRKHLVLKSVHPSPLSAHRGFLDCGHFKKANEWLRERYGAGGEIDWDLNVEPEEAGV